MGVQNLWKLLKESHCMDKNMNWSTMNGSIWAVDLSFWIVEASTAMQHVRSMDPSFRPHLRNLFFRIKHLLSLGILLIFVFDGAPPPQKFITLRKRGVLGNINRRNNKKKYSQSVFGRQCKECKQLLDILGFPYIDLKYGEAEAFCSKLNKYGIVNAVLTPDGDSFLFGANKVFTQYQKTNPIITCCNIAQSHLNQRTFIALGLLLGSDYCPGVKGIGYKTAHKLIQNAMNEYGINSYNDNNDALFHIIKWCQMNDDQIQILFEKQGDRKKQKQSQKFIHQIRNTYGDHVYLNDIVEAYLNPEFHRDDEAKLFNKLWIKWKCPNFEEMIMFCGSYLQMDVKNVMQHTLDIAFDLYLFGFVDKSEINTFTMSHIIKSRVRSKIPMYSIQWTCNDANIKHQIFGNDELELKCEGLHWADAVQQLHPQLAQQFEVHVAEKKANKKPNKKGNPKKQSKTSNDKESDCKTKKKKRYNKYNKTDWKKPIDTKSNATIYTQNVDALNDLNDLLSSISLESSQKKKKCTPLSPIVYDENRNDLNRMKPKKKRVVKSKKNRLRGRKRVNTCLLEVSSDDDADSENSESITAMSLRERIQYKKQQKKKALVPRKSKARKCEQNTHQKDSNETDWKCELCLYRNGVQNGVCGMCGSKKKVESNGASDQWECEDCTFVNDSTDAVCEVCGYTKKKKKKANATQKKNKACASPSILNTSTATLTWKCSYCKKMIPIHVYECPHC